MPGAMAEGSRARILIAITHHLLKIPIQVRNAARLLAKSARSAATLPATCVLPEEASASKLCAHKIVLCKQC